jgi:hypothetical protein
MGKKIVMGVAIKINNLSLQFSTRNVGVISKKNLTVKDIHRNELSFRASK